jgi:GntR family transcriptional regulator
MVAHNSAGSAMPFAGPLYAQVAAMLRGKICASEWSPTAPLPNEAALAKDIGVSIGTVRKALEILEDERLIYRRQGRGTFVVEISEDTELERFSNIISSGKKLKAIAVPMTATVGDVTGEERNRLNLREGAKVIRFESVWTASETFRVFERICVPHERFAGLETLDIRSGQFLFPLYRRHHNVVIAKVVEQLSCVNADDAVAGKLGVPKDKAIMRIDRVARAMSAGPVEWSVRYALMGDAVYQVSMT